MRKQKKETGSLRAFYKKRALVKSKYGRRGEADVRIGPYMYFFHCLSDQEETIEQVLKLIAKAEKESQRARIELEATGRRSPALDDIWHEMKLEDEQAQHGEVQNVFAGALFVILNNLLQSMISRVHKVGGNKAPKEAGRRIGRCSMFQLIRAASNNFRHHEEWHGATSKKNENIAYLRAAGLKRPWDRNMCADALKLTGWTDKEKLCLEIRKLASELFRAQTGIQL